jgi:hypothetical protein
MRIAVCGLRIGDGRRTTDDGRIGGTLLPAVFRLPSVVASALALMLLPGVASAHPVDQARKLPPTKAAPQLKEAAQAQQAARQQLVQEGRYACCIRGGCGMCAQDGAACPCAKLLAAGSGVCGECWEGWKSGQGAVGGVKPESVKLRPHPATEEEYQRGLRPTAAGEVLQRDRTLLDNAKRTMVGEQRYSCCVRPGCDSCARAGACPCGSNVVAGKGVCGECLDGWHSNHGAFAGVSPAEVKLEAMEMPAGHGANGVGRGMGMGHGAGMEHMDSGIPGASMRRQGSGTSWQPDTSPMWQVMPRMRGGSRRGGPQEGSTRGRLDSDGRQAGAWPLGTAYLVALLAPDLQPGAQRPGQPHTHPPFPEVQPPVLPPTTPTPGAPGAPRAGAMGGMAGGPMGMGHAWHWMYMGNAFVDYVNESGPRGQARLVSENWAMAMGHRMLGRGELMLMLMNSLEPATIGNNGVPELFQVGEGLIDHQHPHDFFMEIAGQYARPINDRFAWTLYVAPVGDPALGPTAYPHRVSAAENPQTPLEHHLQDSTHISFGVLTAGIQSNLLRLEGSVFNGHEPDNENRWDIDRVTLNSFSLRLSCNPGRNWSLQASRGWLNHPELMEPGNITRTTFSATYSRTAPHGFLASSFIWGRNEQELVGKPLDGILIEGVCNWADKNYVFGRIERLDRNDLFPTGPLHEAIFKINAFNAGYSRDIGRTRYLDIALGGSITVYAFPESLKPFYGDFPVGGRVFLRFRPRRMQMIANHAAGGGDAATPRRQDEGPTPPKERAPAGDKPGL